MTKKKLCHNCYKNINDFVQMKDKTKEMRKILAENPKVGDDSFA